MPARVVEAPLSPAIFGPLLQPLLFAIGLELAQRRERRNGQQYESVTNEDF